MVRSANRILRRFWFHNKYFLRPQRRLINRVFTSVFRFMVQKPRQTSTRLIKQCVPIRILTISTKTLSNDCVKAQKFYRLWTPGWMAGLIIGIEREPWPAHWPGATVVDWKETRRRWTSSAPGKDTEKRGVLRTLPSRSVSYFLSINLLRGAHAARPWPSEACLRPSRCRLRGFGGQARPALVSRKKSL